MLINVYVPKADTTFSIETDDLPQVSNHYAMAYGLKQAIVDTTAGVKRSDFDSTEAFNLAALAKAQVRVDQILSGDVPGTRAPADQSVATAKKLARECEAAGVTVEMVLADYLARQAEQNRAA